MALLDENEELVASLIPDGAETGKDGFVAGDTTAQMAQIEIQDKECRNCTVGVLANKLR